MWLNVGSEFWEPQSGGYKTKDTCIEALRNIEVKRKRGNELVFLDDVNNGVLTIRLTLPDGKTLINQWRCVPDTIDPRTPTGK